VKKLKLVKIRKLEKERKAVKLLTKENKRKLCDKYVVFLFKRVNKINLSKSFIMIRNLRYDRFR